VGKLERIFASKCRTKILKVLAKHGETNIMNLVRKTNSTWSEVDRNIKFLEEVELVETRLWHNRRLIKLKERDGKVEAVLKALNILEMTSLEQLIL
jgi:predicted transcriptional regulator